MNGKIKNVGLVSGGVSLAFLINFAIGYGEVQEKVVRNKEEIVEVKANVAKNVEDIDIEENLNITQTTLLQGLTKSVDRLNEKIDKELKAN